MSRSHALLAPFLSLVCAAGCFSPTWEARLSADGGRQRDGGWPTDAGQCDPPCTGGTYCDLGGCRPCSETCWGECGFNVCNESCGTCGAGTYCNAERRCAPLGKPDGGVWPDAGVRPDGGIRPDGGFRSDACTPFCDWKAGGDDGCGGTCGVCKPGTTCQWGTCVGTECNPPCTAFQYCDTTMVDPYCIEICDPPVGCQAGEICDVTTGACVPATCNGAQCSAGQGCYDPATLGPGNVCTCLPGHYDGFGNWVEDTCAAYGQACAWDWAAPGPALCGAPGEFESCQLALGCQAGLECVDFGSGYALCLQACTKTAECANPMTNCLPAAKRHCWYAICAEPETRPGDRQFYFKPCPSSGATDGICLPYASQDTNGNPIDLGICQQTGTAASLGRCGADADRTRPGELCPQGQWCAPAAPDPARPGERLGVCHAGCNAAPSPVPVAPCPAGETCADMSSAAEGTMAEARLGGCYQSCSLFGADACPPDVLGDKAGCMPNFNFDGTAFCYAQQPGASGKGGPCTWDTVVDPRSPCQDRLACTDQGYGGTCSAFCDPVACPGYQPCPACAPQGICYALGTVGICY